MKSKILLSLALSVSVMGAIAQKNNVGIGTTKPDQSAALEVSSTTQGFLPPRVTLQQRNSIQNPATGLMVYQSDFLAGTYQFDGKEWKTLGVSASANSVADAFNWGLTGNGGTNSATNFIGTTDNMNFLIKVNNQVSAIINPNNGNPPSIYLGNLAGTANGAIGNVGIGPNTLVGQTPTVPGTGKFNVGVGNSTLFNNRNGDDNLAIGNSALFANTNGSSNTSMGSNSLRFNTTGSNNLALGGFSLFNNIGGADNVAIGNNAGYNSTGSRNIFIGKQSGENETGDDKMYIANTNTNMPLLYGDFSAKYISIGDITPALRTQGIGGGYNLLVKGGILTEKVKVAVAAAGTDWADYVFEKNYKMMPLEQVEKFVKENKHLPNVPTTTEMMANGNDLIKTDAKLLEKIEELTLYLIELNKKVNNLEKENQKLQELSSNIKK